MTDELCLARVVLWSSGAFWCPALQRCCCCASALGKGGGVLSEWRLVLPCLVRVGLVSLVSVMGGVLLRLLRHLVECQQQACWVSPLQVQHIYSVHVACLALVLGDSSWIERFLTANTQKTGHNDIVSEWDPNFVLFSPRWDVQDYSTPATCAVESARNLSWSRATVLISIYSVQRPTHIYIYEILLCLMSLGSYVCATP